MQIDTAKIVAQINKEKARLAILLMEFRRQESRKKSTRRVDAEGNLVRLI